MRWSLRQRDFTFWVTFSYSRRRDRRLSSLNLFDWRRQLYTGWAYHNQLLLSWGHSGSLASVANRRSCCSRVGAEFPSKRVCSTRVSSQLDQKIPVNNLKYIEQGCDLTKESVTPLSSFVFSLFCQASLQKFIIMFAFSDKTQQKKQTIKCDKSMKTINSFTRSGEFGERSKVPSSQPHTDHEVVFEHRNSSP